MFLEDHQDGSLSGMVILQETVIDCRGGALELVRVHVVQRPMEQTVRESLSLRRPPETSRDEMHAETIVGYCSVSDPASSEGVHETLHPYLLSDREHVSVRTGAGLRAQAIRGRQ